MSESDIGPGAPVRLSAGDPERDALVAGRVTLVVGDEPVELELVVQAGPVAMEDVLPIFQSLSDLFVDRAVAKATAEGRTVSCRAGCGACCRQLVPVSETEARALARLVEEMDEPRRTEVRRRFDAALSALASSALLERASSASTDGNQAELDRNYFRQGIACPFLQDEACSIYADRPLACREYLVTSPAGLCQEPTLETIARVRLDGLPSRALFEASRAATKDGWMPLVLALRFAEQETSSLRDRTGPDILRDVLNRL